LSFKRFRVVARLPFRPTSKSKHSWSGTEAPMAKLFALLSAKIVAPTTMTKCKEMAFGWQHFTTSCGRMARFATRCD